MILDLEPGDARWATALPVLRELRPHLTDELLELVLREGAPQGLRFTAYCKTIAAWLSPAGE